ncbi:hypothetical protein B0H17DRAFT_1148349 [Mycena rosella]|uniref:Uncharacterized protein n=1 Tax=Mycena rosella TaxID=1033263 RepID=A0AAD7FVK5_MYCRO|nr:hypothetical protein B0H17DRAFT_1148349 [Mycena rosella]
MLGCPNTLENPFLYWTPDSPLEGVTNKPLDESANSVIVHVAAAGRTPAWSLSNTHPSLCCLGAESKTEGYPCILLGRASTGTLSPTTQDLLGYFIPLACALPGMECSILEALKALQKSPQLAPKTGRFPRQQAMVEKTISCEDCTKIEIGDLVPEKLQLLIFKRRVEIFQEASITHLSQLRIGLEPHFLTSNSVSDCFRYQSNTGIQDVSVTGRIADIKCRSLSPDGTPLYTVFLESTTSTRLDIVNHAIQADALNQLIDSGCYVLADSWTTDRLICPVADLPSALTPCGKYIVIQHSFVCTSRMSSLQIGDIVSVYMSLFRRDSFADSQAIKVYTALATSFTVLFR